MFRHFFVCFWMMFLTLARLGAHEVSSVEFEFQKLPEKWRLLGQMDIAYMLPETRDVPGAQPLSRIAVMKESPEVLARYREETEKRLRSLLTLKFNDKVVPWEIEFPDFEKQPFELPEETGDWALLSTRILVEPQPGPGELRAAWSSTVNSELIVEIVNGDNFTIQSARGGSDMLLLKIEVDSEGSEKVSHASPWTAFKSWLHSGYEHVIPLGYDHMLFMLGLFLLLPKWKPLMGQSLLFTISHSITLSLAVLGFIHLPSKLIEVMIAASIAWVGIENLFVQKLGKNRLILIFLFGLLHGMGFASVLQEKLGDIPKDKLALPLFGFNLGVELAQITVLLAAFIVLALLKRWVKQVKLVGSVFVAGAGIFWMVERLLS